MESISQPLYTLIGKLRRAQEDRDEAEKDYKFAKDALLDYLEKHPKDMKLARSEGIRTDFGLVTFQTRRAWAFNKRLIQRLVEKGELALETLVNLASFKADELSAAIGSKEFDRLAEAQESESLIFRKGAS